MKSFLSKIHRLDFTVGIIGLGYVGLPLMWAFHQKGINVLGYDIDESKVAHLRKGVPYIKHLGKEMMEVLAKSELSDATTDFFQTSRVRCNFNMCSNSFESA